MTRKRSHHTPAFTQAALERSPEPTQAPNWTPATRIAFRFALVYLGLFCLATQISGSMIPNLSFTYRGMGRLWPMRDVTHWTAASVFGVTSRLDDVSGGEPLFFWVQTFWLLIVSVLAVAIWSVLDRRRQSYVTLYAWFRLFVRLALAAALFEYGMTKVIPTQFPVPPLTTLVTPVGDLTLSALLWTSIGASQPYEIFTGCVEVLAGVLLLIPRTTTLGALIGLGALIQIFALNMTYDIGLKLVSLHLIVLALFLLAPSVPPLANLLLRNQPAQIPIEPRLARTRRGHLVALAAPIVFGVYVLGMYAYINWSFWQVAGGGRPQSALYGIWNVEQLSIDGQVRSPHLNDYDRRWRRVIFDEPGSVVFQRTDDSLARYGASIDSDRNVLALTKGDSRNWAATFTFDRSAQDRLIVEGEMDGYRIQAQLRQVEFDAFPLLNSSFRWIRPHER
jgi:hypothetical protein